MRREDQQPEGPEAGDERAALDRRTALRAGAVAAAGVMGAFVASAITASPAAAGTDGDITIGAENVGTGKRTALTADIDKGEVAGFFNDADTGAGVRGRGGTYSGSAVGDLGSDAIGVYGESYTGIGVLGRTGGGSAAVKGITNADFGTAVSGSESGPGGCGVRGEATWTNDSGLSSHAVGVAGTAIGTDSTGIKGFSTDGTGAVGESERGTGVRASSISGSALDVDGKATFTRSGVLTIPAGANRAKTAPIPGGLTGSSHVLATLQTHLSSGTQPQVQAAVPSTATGQVVIFLDANAPAGGVKVWDPLESTCRHASLSIL